MKNTTNPILELKKSLMNYFWNHHQFELFYKLNNQQEIEYYWIPKNKKTNGLKFLNLQPLNSHYHTDKPFTFQILNLSRTEVETLLLPFFQKYWNKNLSINALLKSFPIQLSNAFIFHLIEQLPLSSQEKIHEIITIDAKQFELSQLSQEDFYSFYQFLQKNTQTSSLCNKFLLHYFQEKKEQINFQNSTKITDFLLNVYENHRELLKNYYSIVPEIKQHLENISFPIFEKNPFPLLFSIQINLEQGAEIAYKEIKDFSNSIHFFTMTYSHYYGLNFHFEKINGHYFLNIYDQKEKDTSMVNEKHFQHRFECLFNQKLLFSNNDEKKIEILFHQLDLEETLHQQKTNNHVLKI
jgi:hypothetical protein